MTPPRRRIGTALAALVFVAAGLAGATPLDTAPPHTIGGPYARLLAQARDLGPARSQPVRVTAELHRAADPIRLRDCAQGHGLTVRWRAGDSWAVVDGDAPAVARAFGVAVHDYRAEFGAPDAARTEVSGLGRIISYTPFREGLPPTPPRDVPDGGLLPTQLWNAYNVTPLTGQGYTGKGATVVVPPWWCSASTASTSRTSTTSPTGSTSRRSPRRWSAACRIAEATMDLLMVHAIAPDAKLVVVNVRPTVEGGATYERLGALMESVDRQFPGAIWSLSIGWGCDRFVTAANLAPVRSANQVATGAAVPGFRDIELGGNAISPGMTGYDMVTGLGSPNVENLVKNILLNRTVTK